MWLAPVQVRVVPITDEQAAGAAAIVDQLKADGLSVEFDSRSDTLSYRIRDAELQKVPYVLVVGQRELDAGTVAVRARGAEKKQEVMSLDAFRERVRTEVAEKALAP